MAEQEVKRLWVYIIARFFAYQSINIQHFWKLIRYMSSVFSYFNVCSTNGLGISWLQKCLPPLVGCCSTPNFFPLLTKFVNFFSKFLENTCGDLKRKKSKTKYKYILCIELIEIFFFSKFQSSMLWRKRKI